MKICQKQMRVFGKASVQFLLVQYPLSRTLVSKNFLLFKMGFGGSVMINRKMEGDSLVVAGTRFLVGD